jgi:N6-adenosine-specific RNA methylase IME4
MKRDWMVKTGGTNNLTTLIMADRTEHSVKPEAAYTLIEAASPPARLEMFARRPRQGWTAWGNEV